MLEPVFNAPSGGRGKMGSRLLCCLAVGLAVLCMPALPAVAADAALPAPVIEQPEGAFHQAVLKFSLPPASPGKPVQNVTAYLVFRAGQGTVEHVLSETGVVSPIEWDMGGPISVWDISGVRIDDKQLSGTLRYRATPLAPDIVSLAVAATIGLDNSVRGKIGESEVTGTVLSAEQLAKSNAFGPGKDWPQYEGPTRNLRGPGTDKPYRENLTQPRLVWMSEERFGAGRENRLDAFHGWSGSWTPIMGDGKIFYMVAEGSPGSPIDQAEKQRLEEEAKKAAAKIRLDMDPWGRTVAERITKIASIDADDVAVAIDAATGQTLWRTRLPKRSFNCAPYNKHEDHGRIGAYADGMVYLMGREGRVYCIDAATGKLVWETSGTFSKQKADALAAGKLPESQNYPVLYVAGEVVLAGGTAFDRRTGKQLWTKRGTGGVVQLEGKPYIVFASGFPNMDVALIEPASGRELWKAQVVGSPVIGFVGTSTLRQLGDVLISGTYDRKTKVSLSTAYQVKLNALEKLWEVKLEDGMFLGSMYNSTLAEGKVILRYQNDASGTIKQRLLAVNAKTGTVEQTVDFAGVFIGQVSAMDDLIFVWPDGCHTRSITDIYSAKELKLLGTWKPQHAQTSAYDHPQLILYVEGRALVRGSNRMFCYDFRKP